MLKGNGQNGHSFMVIGSNGLTNLCHVSSAARCQRAKGPSLGSYLAQLSGSHDLSGNVSHAHEVAQVSAGIFWYLAAFYQMLLKYIKREPEPLSWPGLSSGRGAS